MWIFGQNGPTARLYITLDKSAYVAGEIVRGRVGLAIFRDMVADGLSIQIRGHEHISWTVLVTEHHKNKGSHTREKTHTRSNAFLDDRIALFVFPRAFAKGNYEFTFAYHSHVSLPGAFVLDRLMRHERVTMMKKKKMRDLRASISYSVHATLDEGCWFSCRNTHARCDLAIHELPKAVTMYCGADYGGGTYDSTTQSVRLLSLLNQGTCEVAMWLAKPVYASGATATLQYRIKNASYVNIHVLRIALFQDIVLRRKSRASDPISTCVTAVEYPGVAAHSDVESFLTLALVHTADGRDLTPTTTGSLIRCSYRLRLQCSISWSPDVCLELPIVIASAIAASTVTVPLATPVPVAEGVPAGIAVPEGKQPPTVPIEEATAVDDAVSAPTVSREGSRFTPSTQIMFD